jgi:hypothetical protein
MEYPAAQPKCQLRWPVNLMFRNFDQNEEAVEGFIQSVKLPESLVSRAHVSHSL